MRRRLLQWAMVLLLTILVGGHWALLQTAAWTGMIVSYAQDAPLTEALSRTFDGDHPCRLCMAVEEGRKSEREQPAIEVRTRLDVFLTTETPGWSRSGQWSELDPPEPDAVTSLCVNSPPCPPPRPA